MQIPFNADEINLIYQFGKQSKIERSVFTPQVLSEVLQDKMRTDANYYMKAIFQQEVREKKKGKNHDLTVAEYKVAKEEEKIEKLSTDKIGLEADILVLNYKKVHYSEEIGGTGRGD